MVRYEVTLPDLGAEAGDEAQVSFWYFDPGEEVTKDEDLVEMITDKATFNVPSPVSGKIVELLADEGEVVKVGKGICLVETNDD
ncbi:MAG: biotin/lipoyl-containing protein [Planctomycetota bacterium]